jgi:hypothetical protein
VRIPILHSAEPVHEPPCPSCSALFCPLFSPFNGTPTFAGSLELQGSDARSQTSGINLNVLRFFNLTIPIALTHPQGIVSRSIEMIILTLRISKSLWLFRWDRSFKLKHAHGPTMIFAQCLPILDKFIGLLCEPSAFADMLSLPQSRDMLDGASGATAIRLYDTERPISRPAWGTYTLHESFDISLISGSSTPTVLSTDPATSVYTPKLSSATAGSNTAPLFSSSQIHLPHDEAVFLKTWGKYTFHKWGADSGRDPDRC